MCNQMKMFGFGLGHDDFQKRFQIINCQTSTVLISGVCFERPLGRPTIEEGQAKGYVDAVCKSTQIKCNLRFSVQGAFKGNIEAVNENESVVGGVFDLFTCGQYLRDELCHGIKDAHSVPDSHKMPRRVLSRSALARRFVELVGETPMQYLTGWRMHLARRLLSESPLGLGGPRRTLSRPDLSNRRDQLAIERPSPTIRHLFNAIPSARYGRV
jgi:hypothetical protein